MRRTSEWSDTPIVRFSLGSTVATRLIVAGSEIAVQEMKKTAPTITACQVGNDDDDDVADHRDQVEDGSARL